jgi:drug/metabolite transporter (DMT)-like permease
MTFSTGLRIVTVVLLGLAVAHCARVILMSLAGHERIPTRDLVGQALIGAGAFIIGWGLVGGTEPAETVMMMVGSMVWVAGMLVQPPKRAT